MGKQNQVLSPPSPTFQAAAKGINPEIATTCTKGHSEDDCQKALLYPAEDGRPPIICPVRLQYSRTDELLGVGSFGIVFSARVNKISIANNTTTSCRIAENDAVEKNNNVPFSCQNRYALKIMTVKRRESKELTMLKKLNHRNIVKLHYFFFSVHEVVEEEEVVTELCLNLFFEKLPITLLDELRQTGRFCEEKALYYLRELLFALEYLHDQDICHRDLKPSNVLVDPGTYRIKLCDFGSAKVIKTNSGPNVSYICSRFYRAPELLLGSEFYDASVDMWSLGCILAELVTGMILFRGEEEPMDQLVEIICVLGPISESDLRRMHSLLPVIDDKILSPRLTQSAGPGSLNELLFTRIRRSNPEGSDEDDVSDDDADLEQISSELLQLISELLQYNPENRPTASAVLELFHLQ